MTSPTLRAEAEAWLLKRFPDYQKDRSVMHVDVEVWTAGARWQKGRETARILELLRNAGVHGFKTAVEYLEKQLNKETEK